MQIHIPSNAFDVISFNGQQQLCHLTCAEGRDLSNYTPNANMADLSVGPGLVARKRG